MRTTRLLGIAALALLSLQGCEGSTPATKVSPDAGDAAADARPDTVDVRPPDDVADALAASDALNADGITQAASDAAGGSNSDGGTDMPVQLSDAGDATPGDAPPFAAPEAGVDLPADRALMPPVEGGDAGTGRLDSATSDHPLGGVDGAMAEAGTDVAGQVPFRLAVAPNRMLDLVFMIDNSPSMAPKQAKLKEQFPKLIDALRDPFDGSLPDLRLAIIDSDLGTGGAYSSGTCGPNDSNGQSLFGDLGKFKMIDGEACGITDANALWLEAGSSGMPNFLGDIGDVFACLASNLGTLGCGEEHSLQTFEFALAASGIGNEAQQQMLRSAAYLGMVLLTDEDDCSAATNDGMFGDLTELRGESASLRCATRAHACDGHNLADAPPGYPTTEAFSAPFATCSARTDACPNPTDGAGETDTSVPTSCSPLKSIKRMADEIKALKMSPEIQVLVAGIFGWPLDDADMGSATYKIAELPNPNTADTTHPYVYDYWPVCYDPNHLPFNPDPTTGFDADAAGWGATGGLRISAFIDEFGENGMKLSICQPDYAAAMFKIGAALSRKMENLCVPARIGQDSTCTATYLFPDAAGNLVRDPTAMPICNGSQSNLPCYSLSANATLCPGSQYLVRVVPVGDPGPPPAGTMLEFDCQ
jgi:hypothetical protein